MLPAFRIALFLSLLPAIASSKDVWLQIAGSVGVFRTDTRIFNPSWSNDISITATYMQRFPSNTRIQKTITVPKRQMLAFDDVVASLFGGTDLGTIKLSSASDFVATSRIYAQLPEGTLGQFVVGQEQLAAKNQGVLIQLKSNGAPGQQGTFRTNTGFVNPNPTDTTLTIRQFDRNSAVVGQPITITVPALGVVFPAPGVLDPSSGNFSDAWLAYESNQPVFGFGSVVDNGTTDQTFVPGFEDAVSGGKDVYLAIAGSVGVFRTDSRIFNPSPTRDITITATFMPRVGESNMTRVEKTITVPKRQMLIFDDVVSSLFQASGLGAIKLSSSDTFVATSRIYAQAPNGTLGQFVVGREASAAKNKGVLTQLKSNGGPGQQGTFRVNTGFVNPNGTDATVTVAQYDRNNAAVGQPMSVSVPAMGVVFPVGSILDPFAGNFSDAWIGYESTQPLFGFGSVVDNGTTDQTFIPAFEDTGTKVTAKVFDVVGSTGSSSRFTVTPGGGNAIRVNLGDVVTLRLRSADVTHGFALDRYVPAPILLPGGQTKEVTFTVDAAGCYQFFCTETTCSTTHLNMVGNLIVDSAACEPDPGPGY